MDEDVKPSDILKGFKKALSKTGYQTSDGEGTVEKIGKCKCGHSGDADGTDHVDLCVAGLTQPGHGHCTKCRCPQFTWVGWME